jgi:glycosyl transferase family 87
MVRRALKPALAGIALLVAACSPAWVGLFSGNGVGDMVVYRFYAHRMTHGLVPYRDFFFDWAPGSVLPVLAPTWLPGPYYVAFHVLAVVYGAVAVAAVAYTLVVLGFHGPRLYGFTAASALFPLALGAISINSLDYWPALFTALGVAALVARHDRLGFGLLGAGVAAKVYPAVLIPLALIWVWRQRGRREALRALAVAVAVVVIVCLPFLVLGPGGVRFSTTTQFERGLQMESLGASILMALDHLGLYHARVVVGRPYSLDIAGALAKAVAVLSSLVTVVLLFWVYRVYWRGRDDVRRFAIACAAALTAYVAFGRVLSPQYLVWLFALVPLAGSVSAVTLLFAACGLTMVWFPGRFFQLQHVGDVSWFVLARNVVLVLVFVALGRHQIEARQAEQPRDEEEPERREQRRQA